jgi:transglutaminase-like putative cysteine protease
VLIVLAMAVAALLVIGLRARYLTPHGWGALGRHINHGLLGAQSAMYPYDGADRWVRLTLLLGGPAVLVPAAALAFWPAKRAGGVLRGVALVLLIVLYGTALAERMPSGQPGRGFALLLLIAAWLWLPRLKLRDAGVAAVVVIAAALVALPVAAKLDRPTGWLDYRNWRVLGNPAGVGYQWDHSYGPIHWPRKGTTLLYVKADGAYYWKAETLDHFDGTHWMRASPSASGTFRTELPATLNPKWMKQIEVTVAGLRGDLVVGAGTPQVVSGGAGDVQRMGDGTVKALDHSLRSGENYTVRTYLPQPTPAEMRAAAGGYQDPFGSYTQLVLPVNNVSGRPTGLTQIDPGLWQSAHIGDPVAGVLMQHSPYAPMYRLATRLANGAPSTYDVVQRVQRYLGSERFVYSEHPPVRRYPLESFLFRDRVGYCQQFSGTMVLMLRMLGIPSRVVTGFAPGTPQPDSPGVYRVRDYDAHSWVEVYFPSIGWVTFDPTPSASPAGLQSDDQVDAAVGAGRTPRALGQSQGPDAAGSTTGGAIAGPSEPTVKWWMVPAGLAVLTAFGLVGLRVRRRAVARAALPPDERALEDLRSALARLGNPVPPGATLTAVEKILEQRGGRDAGRYARLLREHRYGSAGTALPRRRDRRRLRRALARTARPLGMLKALRALPPLHF